MKNSILSPTYWRNAVGEIKNLRRIIFAALICGLCIVAGAWFIPVGENLRIYFTFFISAVGCAVYGPIVGIIAAAVTDTLNFFLFPSGAYFPGYLLSEMCAYLIYALFLYRKKITVLRLFSAKFLVNYLVNMGMGSLWSQILFGKGYLYYLVKSLIKNTLLLPLEVILMAMVFAVLIPIFSRFGMLPAHNDKDLEKLTISSSTFYVFGIDFIVSGVFAFIYSARLETPSLPLQILGGCLIVLGIALLIIRMIRGHKKSEQ